MCRWEKRVDEGYSTARNRGTGDATSAFITGNVAMTLDSTAALKSLLVNVDNRFEIGTAYFPSINADDEGGVSIGGGVRTPDITLNALVNSGAKAFTLGAAGGAVAVGAAVALTKPAPTAHTHTAAPPDADPVVAPATPPTASIPTPTDATPPPTPSAAQGHSPSAPLTTPVLRVRGPVEKVSPSPGKSVWHITEFYILMNCQSTAVTYWRFFANRWKIGRLPCHASDAM